MGDGAKPDLLEGPIAPALARIAFPTALGVLLILSNNLIDTYFVSQLGHEALTAMSFTFPVAGGVASVGMGLGIGGTAAIARALGRGEEHSARRLCTHALMLAMTIVALVSLGGWLTQEPLFRSLGASGDSLDLVTRYMTIWYAGAVFLVVPMVGTGAMRASGDAGTPARLMAFVALSNAALDPLLIFGLGPIPAMGIEGAAYATLLARALSLLATLWVLDQRGLVDWHIPRWPDLRASWAEILSVGFPAAITNVVAPVATGAITALLARQGEAAVAAYGVASRIEGMALIPLFGLGAAMTPFVGQNWGAHQRMRVARGLALAQRFSLGWGLVAYLAGLALSPAIGATFSEDPAVTKALADYMWIVPLSWGASGIVSVTSAVFNAIDRAVRSTVLSLLRSLFLAVPLAWLGAQVAGLQGLFSGLSAASLLVAVVAFMWGRRALAEAPDEAAALAPLPKAEQLNPGRKLESAIDELLAGMAAAPGVVVAARPINTIGFYRHGFELGHVHASGHVDIHVYPRLHDALIQAGLAREHRHRHDSTWLSHELHDHHQAKESLWLFSLVEMGAELRLGELDLAGLRTRLDALEPKPPAPVRAALEACACAPAA